MMRPPNRMASPRHCLSPRPPPKLLQPFRPSPNPVVGLGGGFTVCRIPLFRESPALTSACSASFWWELRCNMECMMEGEAPSITGEMLQQAKGATLISHLKVCAPTARPAPIE